MPFCTPSLAVPPLDPISEKTLPDKVTPARVTDRLADVGKGLLPNPVCRAFAAMLFVAVPGVEEVTFTVIVQPPAGMTAPLEYVIEPLPGAAVTATVLQVPPIAGTLATVMPDGRKSVNAAESVVAAALLFPSVIVRVLVPPDVIAVGENDLSTDGGVVRPTANIPVASAVLLPRLVFRSPAAMMFMETPGALDVTSTDMLQPPGGITAPDAKLTVALPAEAVTDALEQLPPMLGVFATRMPAGSVSISADVSSAAVALLLPSEMVRVLTEPPAIAEGENCFATVGGAKVTFRSAVTGPALLPRFVCSVLAARLLVAVPGVAEVTSRLMAQPVVAGMTAPLA